MSILAPLFLLGLISIGLPIWLHRLQTQSPERNPFSSTMLMERSQQHVHLRRKLRYITLLVFRILFLVLLVFAFAKPVIQRPAIIAAGEEAVLHLIVVDTSFSMGYGDRFDNARSGAAGIVNGMADKDLAQVISAGSSMEITGDISNIRADLVGAINSLEPGTGRLDLGMLIANLGRHVQDFQQNISLHLVSDFQESGLPARFADLVPDSLKDKVTNLELHPVSGDETMNLFLESVTETENGIDVGVRGNHDDPVEVGLALRINGMVHEELTFVVDPDMQAFFEFTAPEYEPGDNRVEARIGRDDALPGDNVRYAVVDNTPPSPVLLITAEPRSLPVRYLSTAVEAGREGYSVEPVSVRELDPRILQRYPWLMIDDLGIIPAELADVLLEYLHSGGSVFAALGEQALPLQLVPVLDYPVESALLTSTSMSPRSVARIDTSHPALAETSGWRDINVTRMMSLETGMAARPIISLDNGAPLLLEQRFGQGRLMLLTSSLDNTWNDIPIRPVFVNFMAETAKYLSGEDQLDRSQVAGDYLQLLQTGTTAGQVHDPDGRNLLSLADTHRSQDIRLHQTGFYEIYTADSVASIAVNPDLRESDLTFMSAEAMQRWQEAITGTQAAAAETGAGSIDIARDPVELWHILLILLGIVVLSESVLANSYLASVKERA